VTPPPTVAPARPEIASQGFPRLQSAWIERATSTDHKSVGLIYIAGSLSFLALAVLEFVLMRVQLLVPENTMIRPEIFDRLLSVSGTTAVVLFAVPLALGLFSYLVPLQIGSRSMAFPRLNLLSVWLYVAGGVSIYASFLYRPAEAGPMALPPLSDDVFTPTAGVDAWIVGVALATLGFVCFAINLVVTLANMRAPGMAWRRVPPLSRAANVCGYVLLVAGPAMLAALTMLMVDRHFDGVFFNAEEGGAPVLYEHLSSLFFTGAHLVVLLAAFGAISEILPTFARKPAFSQRATSACLSAIGAIGLLTWMQNMYSAPIPLGFQYFAMATSLALVVPVGILIFNWIATLWSGALRPRAPLMYALGAISVITLGLAGELALSIVPVGLQLDNTTFSQAAQIDVLVGAGVLGGLAALHYWLPKISGRLVAERPARAAFWIILIGTYLLDLFLVLAGLKGQPADAYEYFEDLGVDGYNLAASIVTFVIAAGVMLALANLVRSYRNGVEAGPDPWGGATLEWFALSPPPEHNFDVVPDVRSGEPLHDIRRAIARREETWPRPPEPERAPATVAAEPPAEPGSLPEESAPAGERDSGEAPLS
jgi:heme/copper-type cytochrome/quinol oxidase subunit 1